MFRSFFNRDDSQNSIGRAAADTGYGEDAEILFLDESEDLVFGEDDDFDLGSEF